MATVSISRSALLPLGAATRICPEPRPIGRFGRSRTVPLFGITRTPFSLSAASRVAIGRELGADSKLGRVKAQENENGGDDNKAFYESAEFWIQVAVVILTFGFVDAGYSGDWSRIGALSVETEAQLRTAAYVVVPLAAAFIWVVGNRKSTQP